MEKIISIQTLKNGPLLVKGEVKLVDGEGKEIPIPPAGAALCRCGASKKKPFCDGTHKTIGFEG